MDDHDDGVTTGTKDHGDRKSHGNKRATGPEVPSRTLARGSKEYLHATGGKYFSTKFHYFCAKYFSSCRIVPPLARDIISTSKNICYVVPNLFCMILPGKIIIPKINLPPSRNREIKIEKLRIGPKFWRSKLARPCIRITL